MIPKKKPAIALLCLSVFTFIIPGLKSTFMPLTVLICLGFWQKWIGSKLDPPICCDIHDWQCWLRHYKCSGSTFSVFAMVPRCSWRDCLVRSWYSDSIIQQDVQWVIISHTWWWLLWWQWNWSPTLFFPSILMKCPFHPTQCIVVSR